MNERNANPAPVQGKVPYQVPNFLFVFTDQQHKFALGCMGNPDVKTPNLDKLAERGVLFRNAYSNCPICTPFRINLFTGLYSSQTDTLTNGRRIPDDCTTLATVLNGAGYRTSYVGKWHIGATGNRPIPEDLRGGFTDFIGYQCYNGFYKDVVFFDEQGNSHEYKRHRTDVTTDIAIERLERISGQPFAMFVSYQAPHYPVQPAPEYEEMYKDVVVHRRPNVIDVDPYTPTHSPPSPKPKEKDPDYQRYGGNLDEYIRLYNAMVTQIDANVGRLLAALERLGVAGNTIVMFTSDHGDMQGSHGLKNKTHPHEESAGIPFIAMVPGGRSGAVSDALISGIDVFPTIVELAGLPPVDGLPGRSFAPLLLAGGDAAEAAEADRVVFSECKDWRMMRRGSFKLVVQGRKMVPVALHDLEKDPYEMVNLVDKSEFKNKIAEMREEMIQAFRNVETLTWLGARVKNAKDGAGVFVAQVPSDAVASFLGFEPGDLITHVNGKRVVNLHEFLDIIESLDDADDVPIKITRGGTTIDLQL